MTPNSPHGRTIDAAALLTTGTEWRSIMSVRERTGFIELFSQDLFVEWRVICTHDLVNREDIYRTGPAGSRALVPIVGDSSTIEYRVRATLGGTVHADPITGIVGATGRAPSISVLYLSQRPGKAEHATRIGQAAEDTAALAAAGGASPTIYPPGHTRHALISVAAPTAAGTAYSGGSAQIDGYWAYGIGFVALGFRDRVQLGQKLIAVDPWMSLVLTNDSQTLTLDALIIWREEAR